jgi:hypothetical protein
MDARMSADRLNAPVSIVETRLTKEDLDAAKRASDEINLHLAANGWATIQNCWVAIRLSDGGSDHVLYDTKQDAVRHQFWEFQCAYICLRSLVQGADAREMAIILRFHREAYEAGFRLPDPDAKNGGPDLLMTTREHDNIKRVLGI